jgi:oligopeptidase B
VHQQLYEYDHATKNKKLIKDFKLKGSPQIVRNEFECKQFLVPSHDGEEVPLNVYFKKGNVKLDRKNRTLIEAYGAYGISMNQGFNIVHTSAMEKGWIIA